tara:strand:- start:37 stop:936 length:900 start_codon:yes stop_codon:yes gene_type:complete
VSGKEKIVVFTDIDLDGIVSYMQLLWFGEKKHIPVISTRVTDFRKSFQGWLKYHDLDNYTQVYILDLDVSQDCIDIVDHPNVIIIDHHKTHVGNVSKYKNASVFVEEKSSNSIHMYNMLKGKRQLTDAQKLLVLMADDYDSYSLKIPKTHQLNLLLWNMQGDRLGKFVKRYRDGFNGFSADEISIIKFYEKSIKNTISELKMFTATIPVNNVDYKFVSTFADKHINDVAEHIIQHAKADIGLVINLNSNKVSFRKNKSIDVDLGKLAISLADGGGHEYAAGGLLNDNMLQLSKIFTPIK